MDDLSYAELQLHVGSQHTQEQGLNERNWGLGLRQFLVDNRTFFMAGAFRNSIERTSAYFGGGYELLSYKHAALRLTIGGVTGYDQPVAMYAIPEIVFRAGHVGMSFGYIPEVTAGDRATAETITASIIGRF